MQTYQFVHIGDLHNKQDARTVDRLRALDQIIDEAIWFPRLAAWLMPGDLFDGQSEAADRNALDVRLRRMAEKAPVVICYGNHDQKGDLDGFANLKGTWPIIVVDRPRCVRIGLPADGLNMFRFATIFVQPYVHKGGLVGAHVATGDIVATAGDILEPTFMVAAAELEEARELGDLSLMVAHMNIRGSISSTGQPNVGQEIELDPRHLDRLGHIYKGFNHIHKPQEIAGAFYAGSGCRMNYGETEAKRYLVAEIALDSSYTVTSHPIDVAPMFLVEGRLTREGFTVDSKNEKDDEEIHRRIAAKDWTGCDVRVEATYLSSERDVVDKAVIDPLFAGALRLKVVTIAEVDRDIRDVAVAAAKTLPEKLAAFYKVDALTPNVADKLALLMANDRDRLTAHVAAVLTHIDTPAVVLEEVGA